MATAGSIVVSLLMNTSSFETDTKRAESIAKKRADAIEKAFSEMGRKIGLAVIAQKAAIAAMVVSTANAAKEISNLANLSGAGTEEFQRFAAGAKSVGIEQDKLGDIFKDFREKVGEFVQTGGGGMKDFFEQVAPKVGITAEAFRNLSGPQALQLYVDSLEKAGLSQEQMSFYLESMASDSTSLIPLLRNGGKEMTALGDAAQSTGQVMNEQTLFAARELSKKMTEFAGIAAGVRNELVGALLPALGEVANQMKSVGNQGAVVSGIAGGIATAFETVTALGLNVSYVLKQIGNEIGGMGAQIAAVMRGDFAQAAEIGRMMKADAAAARAQVDKDTEAIINARNKIIGTGSGVRGAGFTDPRLLGTVPTVGGLSPPGKPTTTNPPRASSSRSASKPDGYQDPDPLGTFISQQSASKEMERYIELEREAVSLRRSLMSEREKQVEQEARYQEMLKAGLITQEEFNKATALPVEEGYWEKWLESAEEAMTSFDELAGNVVENFSSQFGNAFEKMVFDSESLGDSISGMAEGMARSVVNALGQMAAQWLAYQAVQMLVGKTTQASAAGAKTFEAMAAQQMAALNAFAATAAIPIVGPAMAPAAAGAALAATSPFVATVASLSAAAVGARADGGPVSDGKPYLVGERGAELFVPNTSGAIVPNHKLGGGNVTVNMIEDKSRAGQTRERMNNGQRELDVFVADIMGDGPRSKAIRQAFGLQRRGY